MTDRADYLARTLIARLQNLRRDSVEDGHREPERPQRLAIIEKILAVELGVTDGATLAAIESEAPSLHALKQARDRETAALADFLRRRLAAHFAPS